MVKHRLTACTVAISAILSSGLTYAAEEIEEKEDDSSKTIYIIGQVNHYSATKSDTPIMETARSVSIETADELRNKGALTVDDAYTYTAGVFGETFGYATRGDWVRVRGLDVPQYQDSLQSLFGNYNNVRPNLYTLEQIEILKGPASVLYGKGSPGGIVNAVSKTPKEESQHELVAEIGNFDRRQFAVDSTGKIDSEGEWLYRFVGLYRDSNTQIEHVKDDGIIIAPSLTWRPGIDTEITFQLNHSKVESDTAAQFLPVYGTLLPAPNGSKIADDRYTGDPGFNRYDTETTSFTVLAFQQISEAWNLELTGRVTDGSADYQQAWTAFIGGDRYVYNADGTLYKDGMVPRSFYRSDATSKQKALDVRFRGIFQTGKVEHEVLIGTQLQDVTTGTAGYYAWAVGFDATTRQPDATFGDSFWINIFNPTYGNIPPKALTDTLYTVNPKTNAKDYGLYISDQISYEDWRLTLGVRLDDSKTKVGTVKQNDDAVSSSIGLLYQFDNGISPYVSYAESFEPVIGDNGNGQPLKPQEGEQVEVGIKYQPNDFPALMTLAYFDIEQSNLTDPAGLPGSYEQQRGVAKINGFEFEMFTKLGDFNLELNATQLDTENANGFHISSVPESQASTWLTYKTDELGVRAGFGARYVGKRHDGTDTLSVSAYTLLDLMLGYQTDAWDFSFNVRNLTDKNYYATCLARGDCFVGDSRTYVGRVSYRF